MKKRRSEVRCSSRKFFYAEVGKMEDVRGKIMA